MTKAKKKKCITTECRWKLCELFKKQIMKYILLATLLCGMFSSCTEPTIKDKPTNYTLRLGNSNDGRNVNIAVIEGCEYFVCFNSSGNILCHKGNCSNLIHKEAKK